MDCNLLHRWVSTETNKNIHINQTEVSNTKQLHICVYSQTHFVCSFLLGARVLIMNENEWKQRTHDKLVMTQYPL